MVGITVCHNSLAREASSEEGPLSSSNLVRLGGGLASLVAGVLLVISVLGAVITCVGFVWLGLALLSGPRSGVSARRPARKLEVPLFGAGRKASALY